MSGDILDNDATLLTLQQKPVLQSTDAQGRIQNTTACSEQDRPKVSVSHRHNAHYGPI